MEALNIHAEFRKAFPNRAIAPTEARVIAWADNKVQFDGWVKDDGDYYTREEWDADMMVDDPNTGDIVPASTITDALEFLLRRDRSED